MRTIAIVNHSAHGGGAEQGMVDIATCLPASEYRVLCVVPERGSLAVRLESIGAEVMTLPLRRLKKTLNPFSLAGYLLGYIGVVPRLAMLFRREEVDIVHANSNTAQLYAGPAARLAGKPCIWHSRDLVELGPLGPFLVGTSDRIICISNAVLNHVSSFCKYPDRPERIYNGINADSYAGIDPRDSLRDELGIGAGSFVVANVGQLVPWKNHHLFLDAAGLIACRIPKAVFVVAGDDMFADHPGYIDELKEYAAKLGIGEKVVFTGYREDIAALYKNLDVLVHAASREPFGRVVAEAMAAGKCVVAVDAGGPSEIIRNGEDGMLVKPDDPRDIADAVIELAQDKGFAETIASTASDRIRRDFNLDSFRQAIGDVYDSLMEGSRR